MGYATQNELVKSSLNPYEVISHKHEQNLNILTQQRALPDFENHTKNKDLNGCTHSKLKKHIANISAEQTLQRTVCIMVCALVAFIGGGEIPIPQTFLF
jgi:hypothetical protein